MTLHPALGPLPGETPASVVSRNAMRHHAPRARTFCLDLGISFQGIVDGKRTALNHLSDLLRVPVDALAGDAIVRTGDRYAYRGQDLVRHSLRRSRVAICPRCLAEDLAGAVEPWMAGGRALWQLAPIRVCGRHGILLIETAHVTGPQSLHDFARNIAGIVPDVTRMADEARSVVPTGLEIYLLDRIAGAAGPGWLDALPWHAAARVCEMIGAVAVDGTHAPINRYGDMEWRRAGEAGHALAANGTEEIRGFLDGMRTACPIRHVDNGGPQAWWGRLHTWLTDSVEETAYGPLRDIILGYMADNVPVGPGDELYGRPIVGRRRLHTIRTASQETGLHPNRLRKILAKGGVLPTGHGDLSDDRVTFDAEPALELLARMHRAIGHAEAMVYLDAGRVQLELLVKHAFIKPCAGSKEDGLRSRTYDPFELDAFLASLSKGAVEVSEPTFPLVGIQEAAKRASCGAAEVVRLILDRKLCSVGRRAGGRGYASILVDCEEVRRFTRLGYGPYVNQRTVEAELKTSTRVVTGLIRAGALTGHRAINPLNRCPYTAVLRADLDAFAARYASLHVLARETGVHHLILKKQLTASGIQPAFDLSIVPAAFYRRDATPG